jgi:hypothetical protein
MLLGCDLDSAQDEALGAELGLWLVGKTGRCASARELSQLGPKPGKEEKPFSFSFLIFQSHFSKDFEFCFGFEINRSVQKFQCSSMSAQSCL